MKKYLQNILKNNFSKKKILLVLPIIFIGLFLVAFPVSAAADWANKIVANILGVFITGLGFLLTLVIRGLIYIATFSTFLDSGAVSYGWVLVRDICNMFFVIILLIIAFGTILNIEKYNYKKWLPKLILMAVLINFSKLICGLLIDIAQVFMLTFVNAFAPVAGGNMVSVLGIDKILTFDTNSEAEVSMWTVVSAYLLGIIYLVVALIVISTMMIMLVVRVVMIWIYVVLSPLAYLLAAFPGGQSYSSRWWSDFTKNLIVGPVLAFFIWLSFAALQSDEIVDAQKADAIDGPKTNLAVDPNESSGATEAATPAALIKYIIAIGMFVGGLKIAQEVGGAAGSVAGKGMGAISKAGKIGMGGVAAVTGYRAAKKIGGNYMAARKQKREQGYQDKATKLAGGIGQVKSKIGQGLSSAKTKVKDYVGLNNFKKSADLDMKSAQGKRSQITQMQDNLGRKDGNIEGYTFDKEQKNWVNENKEVKSQDEMRVIVNVVKDKLESEATKEEESSRRKMKKQKTVDKVTKVGAVVGGIALGGAAALVSGGAGLAIAGAGVAASKDNKKWGNVDKSIGSNWGLDKVKDKKGKMRESGNEEVLTKMDNQSLDKFDRAAAALEAMDRGLLSSNQAENKREEIKRDFGGEDKKTGGFKDKKMGNYFDATAEKSYASTTQRFKDLNSKPEDQEDQNKREAMQERKSVARERIKGDFEGGRLEIDKIDSGAFTSELAEVISSALGTANFSKQFENIKDPNKKAEVLNSMHQASKKDTSSLQGVEKTNTEFAKLESMKKVAAVTDLDTATKVSDNPTPAQRSEAKENKLKIISNYSIEDLSKPLSSGNQSQASAIKSSFVGMSKTEILNTFNEATRNMIKGDSPMAKSVRKHIGIDTNLGENNPSNNTENIVTDNLNTNFQEARNNRKA